MSQRSYSQHGLRHSPDGTDPVKSGIWHVVADSAETAWDSGTHYSVNDLVSDGNWNYICIASDAIISGTSTPNTGIEPGVDAGWQQFWNLTVPFFQNGWANSGGTYVPMRYRLLVGCSITGQDIDTGHTAIEIQGSVTGGSGTIFSLPDGFRPDSDLHLSACDDSGAFTVFTVQSGGDVIGGFV